MAIEVCEHCGHPNEDAKFCQQCGKPLLNPYRAPLDEDEEAPARAQELASRGARLGAAIIDSIYLSVVNIPVLAASGLVDFSRPDIPMSRLVLALGLGFIVFAVLQGFFLVRGQTLGKKLLGLRMVDNRSGAPAPIGRLLGGRYLPLYLLQLLPLAGPLIGLVDVLMIFRQDRRCLHDHFASTRVVRAP